MLRFFVRTFVLISLLATALLYGGEGKAETIAVANNALSQKLLRELGKKEGNLFFSPYSIHTALSMTWAGAKGQTATEMAEVLALGKGAVADVAGDHGALAKSLAAAGQDKVKLEVANALFGAENYPFLPAFLDLNKKHFGAGLELCDFKGQPDVERRRINTWVEGKTAKKIVDLLPAGSIVPLTRLVLVNAVYFKADWDVPFEKKATIDADFLPTCPPGKEVAPLGKVKLMHRKATIGYSETDKLPVLADPPLPAAQVACLPYVGKQTEMLVLLPKEATPAALAALEQRLDVIVQHVRLLPIEVDLYLPRFEMRWGTESLKPALTALGMPTAFSPQADFTGMAETNELSISDVLHQAYVKVDEEGTEAAAATAVVMIGCAAPPKPIVLRADRPFLFVIRHKSTKAVLFVGRVANPCK